MNAILSDKDYWQFLDAHQSLLLYVGKKEGVLEQDLTLEELRNEGDGKRMMA